MFQSEAAAYVGVIAIVLAVMAVAIRWRRAEVLAFAVFVIGTAAIVFLPGLAKAMNEFPGVGGVIWQRSLLPMAFGTAVLAGVGVDILVRREREREVRRWMAGGFSVFALLLIGIFIGGRGRLPVSEAADRTKSLLWPAIETTTGLVVMALLTLLSRRSARSRRTAVGNSNYEAAGGTSQSVGELTHFPIFGATRWAALVLILCETTFLIGSGIPWFSSSTRSLAPTPTEMALRGAVGNSIVGVGSGTCGKLGILPETNAAFGIHELDLYDPVVPEAYFSELTNVTGELGGLPEYLNRILP